MKKAVPAREPDGAAEVLLRNKDDINLVIGPVRYPVEQSMTVFTRLSRVSDSSWFERPTGQRVVAAWRAGSQRRQQPRPLPSMCTLAQTWSASLPRFWLEQSKAGPLRHIAGTDRTLTLPPSVTTRPVVWELALFRGWKSEQNSSRASIMHIGQIQPPSSTHDFDDELRMSEFCEAIWPCECTTKMRKAVEAERAADASSLA
jgi:hypothetical protein